MKESFGTYIRSHRLVAKLSLRKVANRLNITHVYLGEVERGIKPPFNKKYWTNLINVIPDIEIDVLERLSASEKPVLINVSRAPRVVQRLACALARWIDEHSILDESEDKDLLRLMEELTNKLNNGAAPLLPVTTKENAWTSSPSTLSRGTIRP